MYNLYLCLASLFLLSCPLSAQLDDMDSNSTELDAYDRYQKVRSINALGQKMELKLRSNYTHKLDSFIYNHLGNRINKFEYRSNIKSDTQIVYGMEDYGWEPSGYWVTNYNAYGQAISGTTHILDGIDGENPVLDKPILLYNENTYDEDNRIIRIESGRYNSTESDISIREYLYDDRGRLSDLISTRFLPQLDTTLTLQHDYYTYDDKLDTLACIDVYKLFSWSSPNANWGFQNKTQFIYNDNAQLDSLVVLGMLDSVLVKSRLYTYQYNSEGKIESELYHARFEDDEWQSIKQTDYVYSEYGSLTELHNYRIKLDDLIIHEEEAWYNRYFEIYEHDASTTFSQILNFRLFDFIKRSGNSTPDMLLEPFHDRMILKRCTNDFSDLVLRKEVSSFYYSAYDLVDIDEPIIDLVTISPNPAVSAVTINATSLTIDEIRIYDINGQFISKSPYSRELDVSALKPGVYLLELIAGDKRFVERFSKVE